MGYLDESVVWEDGIPYFEANAVLTGGPDCPDNVPLRALANRTFFLKKQIDDAVSGALTVMHANRLETPRSIAMTGDGSWVVTFDGSGNVTAALTLSATGVVAGTYPVVTIDSKGRVTAARALQAADLPADLALSGTPTVPTAPLGANNLQLANTAFVQAAIASLIASSPAALDTLNELAAALGNDANFAATMTNALAAKAPLVSPALSGAPTAPTAAPGTNTTQLANTAFVQAALAGKVDLSQVTGSNQSLATSGYQKLPGGIIIQWGDVTVAATGSYVNLPISFQTVFSAVVTSMAVAALPGVTANNNCGVQASPDGLTRFIARCYQDAAGVSKQVKWFAIGY